MIAVFCGSRTWSDPAPMAALASALTGWGLYIVVEGEQRGADLAARSAAEDLGIHVLAYPADWERLGPRAGPVRNAEMLAALRSAMSWGQGALCVAFHDDPGLGTGTRDMVEKCRSAGIPVLAWVVPSPSERTASCPCGDEPESHPVLLPSGSRLSCDGREIRAS